MRSGLCRANRQRDGGCGAAYGIAGVVFAAVEGAAAFGKFLEQSSPGAAARVFVFWVKSQGGVARAEAGEEAGGLFGGSWVGRAAAWTGGMTKIVRV